MGNSYKANKALQSQSKQGQSNDDQSTPPVHCPYLVLVVCMIWIFSIQKVELWIPLFVLLDTDLKFHSISSDKVCCLVNNV